MYPSRSKMLCLFVLIMSMMMLASSLFASEMMMLVGRNGLPIPADSISNCLNHFKYFSNENHDGWGIVAFDKYGVPIPGKKWILTGAVNTGYQYNSTPDPYKFSGSMETYYDNFAVYDSVTAYLASKEVYILIAHIRNANGGYVSNINKVPDPHPFVWKNGNRYFAFAHHGPLLTNEINSLNAYTNSVSTTLFSSLVNSGVDSGNLFAYILANLYNKNFDLLKGLNQALTKSNYTFVQRPKNFLLSDGFQAIASCKTFDSSYRLFSNFNKNFTGTTANSPYFVISDRHTSFPFPGFNYDLDLMDYDRLQYYALNSRPLDMKFETTINVKRKLSTVLNYNYESFPILNPNLAPAYVLNDFPAATEAHWQNTSPQAMQNILRRNGAGQWYVTGTYNFSYVNGHKIYVPNRTSFSRIGINSGIINPNSYSFNLQANTSNWVGYWYMTNQTLAQALGSNLSKIKSVRGEKWHYQVGDINSKIDPDPTPTLNPNSLIMEFGKMYIIELKAGETSIPNFTWLDNRYGTSKNEIMEFSNELYPEYFSFMDKDEYETINIANVDENSGIEEIAVYVGDDCIGATKLSSYPVQILAYTKGYEGMSLTFRAITNNKAEGEISLLGKLIASDKSDNSGLIAGQLGYVGVNLYKNENSVITQTATLIKNVAGYPNPFNPTTTIKFSLVEASNVCLDIYNIKGQKVKSLVNQKLAMGTHGIIWNGQDNNGKQAASGVYYYKISTDKESAMGKLLMLK